MPPSSVAPYLTDIIEAIEHVREKSGTSSLEEFKRDWEQQWIVQRGIEIVSEASRRLPEAIKALYPHIPWPKIAAIGNVLRHEYLQVRLHSYGKSCRTTWHRWRPPAVWN